MNALQQKLKDIASTAVTHIIDREKYGPVNCYGWDYQPQRPSKQISSDSVSQHKKVKSNDF